MTQKTVVVRLPKSEFEPVRRAVEAAFGATAEWRRVPHAAWSAKADGIVITVYNSGKAVVQGVSADGFVDRFLSAGRLAPKKTAEVQQADADLPVDRPAFGSDEAGKGDFFGPLVVAAAHVQPSDHAWLLEAGVTDSKALTDRRANQLAGLMQSRLDHEVRSLEPAAYNARYRLESNVNTILADLHSEVLSALAARHPEVELAIVDRFGPERQVASALKARDQVFVNLVQVPRAERHPAVAAASVFARSAFLDGLARCEESAATDLHKGAGAPVDVAAKRVVRLGGRKLLETVAKMHFKNRQRAGLSGEENHD